MAKLVSITVIRNATQSNVTGPKNWAAVKKSSDEVIVEATTNPNDAAAWDQIVWSADSGVAVPGKANQRKLSRATSRKIHVEAALNGVTDFVDVWILWAKVVINTSGTTPANSAQFGAIEDGTETLGAVSYSGGNAAAGKVAPVALLTPAGVHAVVKAGWNFRRERISHDWIDGVKNVAANYWNNTWVDDTSLAQWKRLVPDAADKIYDLDGPNIFALGVSDAETYNNFRQWIEWRGETCSGRAAWYFKARWQANKIPQITLKKVGTGNIKLPTTSFFHP